MAENSSSENPTRAGFVALIGAPNAGKSTLLNRLVGQKVSIVTHKVQTTRATIRGIAVAGQSQIVFVDTPGIFSANKRLERAMVAAAWGGAKQANFIALLVDASSSKRVEESQKIATELAATKLACLLILNKIDLTDRTQLLAIAARFNEICPFIETFMISATSGDGTGDLLEWLAGAVPEGPWLYPDDQYTDAPARLLAAEVTREKLFLRLHEELPYALAVETENWKAGKGGSVRIEQVIYVERDSQKKIVLGRNGATIKAVSMEARQEMGEIFGCTVHLFLFVKVRRNWAQDPERYRAMGLDFDRS
ncbi:MAG: GTPase Era [Alphaproteobacteria bacterium]